MKSGSHSFFLSCIAYDDISLIATVPSSDEYISRKLRRITYANAIKTLLIRLLWRRPTGGSRRTPPDVRNFDRCANRRSRKPPPQRGFFWFRIQSGALAANESEGNQSHANQGQ